MARPVTMRLVLTGPLAGATRVLNGHYFEKGVCVIRGSGETVENVLTYMARSYQAYPEGSVELQQAQAAYPDAVESKIRELKANGVRNIPAYLKRAQTATQVSSDIQPQGQGTSQVSTAHGQDPGAGAPGDAGTVPGGDGLPDAGATDPQQTPGPDGDAGQGQQTPPPLTDSRLKAAVMALDPANDEHWTGQGLPAMSAVEAAYGSADITRNDVEAECPGWTRDKAREAAA